MSYPLNRKALAACLNRLKNAGDEEISKDAEFQFYHKNRNYFNTLDDAGNRMIIRNLRRTGFKTFVDNYDRTWTEVLVGVVYHRPFFGKGKEYAIKEKLDFITDFTQPRNKRFSRKFICPDPFMAEEGFNGGSEFEMIVRLNNRLTTGEYMETYNFGETGLFGYHKKFDIEPHKRSPIYETGHYASLPIKINE